MVLHVQTMQKINGVNKEGKEVLGKKNGFGQQILMVWTLYPLAVFAVEVEDQVNPLVTGKYYETSLDVLH